MRRPQKVYKIDICERLMNAGASQERIGKALDIEPNAVRRMMAIIIGRQHASLSRRGAMDAQGEMAEDFAL